MVRLLTRAVRCSPAQNRDCKGADAQTFMTPCLTQSTWPWSGSRPGEPDGAAREYAKGRSRRARRGEPRNYTSLHRSGWDRDAASADSDRRGTGCLQPFGLINSDRAEAALRARRVRLPWRGVPLNGCGAPVGAPQQPIDLLCVTPGCPSPRGHRPPWAAPSGLRARRSD